MSFVVVQRTATAGLEVYATALRIERLGDGHELELEVESCGVTLLTAGSLSDDTICPNGLRLGTMREETLTLDLALAMRAGQPPSPPTCVPSDQAYCPPSVSH